MAPEIADALTDFTRGSFTFEGETHEVFRSGTGPAVIVMAEIPGITPNVANFARRVRELGCSVYLPVLFGTPGRAPSGSYIAKSMAKGCVSKEFAAFATGKTEPLSIWLRALARHAHAECGGPGVGAIGMCFTGGFALGMTVDPSVIAPVLSQVEQRVHDKLTGTVICYFAAALNAVDRGVRRVHRKARGICRVSATWRRYTQ
jgi:dienelactone hydrolase